MHLTFGSRKTNSNEISNIIDDLNIEKACQNSDVPTKIININNNNIAPFLSENCNSSNDKGEFSNDLKYASIVPVQKSKSKPTIQIVGQLAYFSKLYGKVMYKQLYLHFEKIFSSSQYGFQKEYTLGFRVNGEF